MKRLAAIAGIAAALAACAGHPPRPSPAALTPIPAPAPPAPPSARTVFVRTARAMVGRAYAYGSDGPRTFDCSGLVYYAAHRAGLEVPRTAEELLAIGRPVARARIRAGDLVFMHFPHKALHVGIAIGRRRFVHAPSTGERVRIDSLANPVYGRAFLAARRLRFAPRARLAPSARARNMPVSRSDHERGSLR